jgi:hypothetical protein
MDQDHKGQKVTKAIRATLVLLAHKEYKVQLDQRGRRATLGIRGQQEQPERLAQRVIPDSQGQLARKGFRE